MTRSDQWKLLSVVTALGLALFYLLPTFRFYSVPRDQRVNAPKDSPIAKLREDAIPLGLDLQGGLHLVLEVDRSRLSDAEAKDAVDRAITILNARIDQFGVAEPLVQRQGKDRIVVQLPGLTDPQRAKDLIGKTARLDFKLVRTPEEAGAVFQRLDASLASRAASGQVGVDSAFAAAPLSSRFADALGGAGFILASDVPEAQRLLARVDSIVPPETQLLWGDEEARNGRDGRWLYVLKRQPELSGGSVSNAVSQIGLDQTAPGAWGVSLQLTPRAGSQFAQITGANVGRQLAIVLDDVVQSAPSIRERIPRGTATITGSFSPEQAKDLAVVLEAGSLPAPVRIAEERTVGPSLGSDSIRDGMRAGLIGAAAVVVFTLLYYRLSGALAVFALGLNMLFLLACLAGFGATLTLPGIAGIALTIGMAVDANVLILERVREELRQGKSVRAAIQTGYDRAFRTILDANVTTLISAAFLFQFGTGPIRGFAVTLAVGIMTNMFTAVFVTRLFYDLLLHRRTLSKLSI
jgi:protein-export membrane protein SecD